METALVKKNVLKVWSTPSFKALKYINLFYFKLIFGIKDRTFFLFAIGR